jgi:hypothetical protein
MIFEIPIDITTATADGAISLDVELDGPTYRLQFEYADCAQLWYMSVFLQSNTTSIPIAQGVPVVTRMPLLIDVQVADRPAGELIVSGDRDAGRTDLGTFCTLRYYDADEIAAL